MGVPPQRGGQSLDHLRPSTVEGDRAKVLEPERLAQTLVIELDDRIIGDLMFQAQDAWAQTEVAEEARGVEAELGWVLSHDCEGHGP